MSLSGMVVGSDDRLIPIDSLEKVITRDGDGNILSVAVTWLGASYVQTYTRDDGKVTAVSGWELQS